MKKISRKNPSKNSSIPTFQNPPNYLSNIFSPRAMEKEGREGKKGGIKKMHKRRTNDRQDSSWTNFRGKSFLRTTTIGPQPSGSQISPHPLQLALVFSPSGYRGPRVTNWSMPHTRPRCSTPREASLWVVEPREIPRPITCGSQLWIN